MTARKRTFEVGDRVLLIDTKNRRYLVILEEAGEFHSHVGVLSHSDILGRNEGAVVRTSKNGALRALRPTLSEYVLKMPRGAQVIYPKDLGPILIMADIFPGAKIFESGIGSGALTMALLRAAAPDGEVIAYEVRTDFAEQAQKNIEGFIGKDETEKSLRIEIRDTYKGIAETEFDRVVLDLPEPWTVVPHAQEALVLGGIFLAYLPTVGQVMQLRAALDESRFGMAETLEVLQRGWNVDGLSVRPNHRMVAHTGFLTGARLLE